MTSKHIFQRAYTESLYNDLRRANTEQAKKERFLQYLTTMFAADAGAQRLIAALALGAERVIANIPRGERVGTGRADSQTETVIIEWEKDLSKTGEHAREQLEEYLEGNWRSGEEYRFVLLTTDGVRWRRYAPDWSTLEMGALSFGRNFKLREVRRFDLVPDRFDDFPFFLDEVLFATQQKSATLENIQNDFGDTSSVFINSIACLKECASDIETQSELKVAFEQWQRFLSIAYGKFDSSPSMFLVHTYLSVFAKFIAYTVITKGISGDDEVIKGVLSGAIFERLNIERFVEDDFFHWVGGEEYFRRLRPMFREINRQLGAYDFSNVREDILKGVYQELIDLETRHALGEYYTPDWLCERVVDGLKLQPASYTLDPACGSGSFLRAVIARMRREFPELGAEAIAEQVVGIDIHPLSVLIAKTTVLLALGESLRAAKRPVTLHIYLANSLLVPRGTADLFETTFHIAVDNVGYALDLKGIDNADDFDQLITFCDDMVDRYPEILARERFVRLAKSVLPAIHAAELPSQLFEVYRGMKVAYDAGRDSIWKFILQNSYKPVFLMNRFDFVVGNPPWLTYASVSNGEYQNLLKKLSDGYSVTPGTQANIPHLEIAAIFLAHSVNYFLKPSGRLAFVMPRSFMTADQHDNTRAGVTAGMKLVEAWDLEGVAPLFRVPSCVLFAIASSEDKAGNALPPGGIPGLSISGKLPRSQIHWTDAEDRLNCAKVRWYYSRLQGGKGRARSALTLEAMKGKKGSNAYANQFTQGATIVPRNFFFVSADLAAASEEDDIRDWVFSVSTNPAVDREAKSPWKGNTLSGRAEGGLLFRTAISRNIIPFGLVAPPLVLLPVVTDESDPKARKFKMLDAEMLLEEGFRYASSWFFEAEKVWNEKRTDANKKSGITLSTYLNWQTKLTGQNPDARYLVLYTSSSTDASAVVIDRMSFDFPFIVDHKAYWCEVNTETEAHYIAAYVNSGYANGKIKEFQSRGLFGPRDIHKTIVKLPFPKFKKDNKDHERLAALGRKCSEAASRYISIGKLDDLQARELGKVRTALREQLATELDEIDTLVEMFSTGASEAVVKAATARKSKRRATTGRLFD